jgi:hypothetical protein
MCYFCGNEFLEKVYKNTECPVCGKDLKICLNCKFYEPGAHWDCRETISEGVKEKDRANFCDYFVYQFRGKGAPPKEEERRSKARNDFNSLFNDG